MTLSLTQLLKRSVSKKKKKLNWWEGSRKEATWSVRDLKHRCLFLIYVAHSTRGGLGLCITEPSLCDAGSHCMGRASHCGRRKRELWRVLQWRPAPQPGKDTPLPLTRQGPQPGGWLGWASREHGEGRAVMGSGGHTERSCPHTSCISPQFGVWLLDEGTSRSPSRRKSCLLGSLLLWLVRGSIQVHRGLLVLPSLTHTSL